MVVGSSLALQAPEALLRVVFAGFLILTGTRLALTTRGDGSAGEPEVAPRA